MTQKLNRKFSNKLKQNTYWDKIQIRDKTFHIKRVKDINYLLDMISDEEFKQDERLPYWAEVWPSAIVLAEFILDIRDEFRNKKVLEIGCGLGLAGMAATAAGASVLFTDHEEDALAYTRNSFRRNFNRDPAVKIMDWRENHLPEAYDIILGADILYEGRWLTPVLNVIIHKMTSTGNVFIAEPNRTVAREFFTLIEKAGLKKQSWLKRAMVCNKLHSVTIHRISKC